MNAYFDTSSVVPLLIDEPATPRAIQAWDAADRAVTTRITYVEARAALAAAARGRRIRPARRDRLVEELHDLMSDMVLIEVTPTLVRRAGDLAQTESLRGYDALHLAAAESVHEVSLVMVTGDVDLLGAALRNGLTAIHTAA